MTDTPADPRTVPPVAGERETLESYLDWCRDTVRMKVAGVSDGDARRRLLPSATSLGGLVKHLRWIEAIWFELVLAGRSPDDLPPRPWRPGDPDGHMTMAPEETLDRLLADYEAQCAASRATAARYGLDVTREHHRFGTVSLRWIYGHMIAETARHAGHADVLRELVDGVTGE